MVLVREVEVEAVLVQYHLAQDRAVLLQVVLELAGHFLEAQYQAVLVQAQAIEQALVAVVDIHH